MYYDESLFIDDAFWKFIVLKSLYSFVIWSVAMWKIILILIHVFFSLQILGIN